VMFVQSPDLTGAKQRWSQVFFSLVNWIYNMLNFYFFSDDK